MINKLLEAFDTNLLDVAANIGDFLVKVDQFITDNELIAKGFEWLADGCKKLLGQSEICLMLFWNFRESATL